MTTLWSDAQAPSWLPPWSHPGRAQTARLHAAPLDDGAAGALFGSVVEVVERLSEPLHRAGFNVGWNDGAAAGHHVFHLHVHVLPRFRDGGSGVQAVGEGPPGAPLEEIAGIILGGRALPGRERTRRLGVPAPRR